MIRAISVTHSHEVPSDIVTLTFENRFRRRIAMVGDGGLEFLLDLPVARELGHGDCLVLEDGRLVRVVAARERLMVATGRNQQHLARAVWHVGNRHLACEIHDDRIVLVFDHVILGMLEKLGCAVVEFEGPFNPEGGAYGQGRTHGHSH